MAIKFFNIRSKEVRVAETEPQITAMWASSDHSPNITQGQDFGWRLAPEVVVEMKRIKQDFMKLQEIAVRYGKPLDAIGEPEILEYISDFSNPNNIPVATDGDYSDEYNQEIRRLEELQSEDDLAQTVTTTETTESIEQLQKRVELEERLAAARAVPETTTTTTTVAKPITPAKGTSSK